MSYDLICFGTPERFQVGLTWLPEEDPVTFRPRCHGWSMAALVLTVAGESITAHRVGDQRQDSLIWYLGPLLHWLADNWVALFHEEHFPWPERSEDPAAAVCNRAIARFTAVGPAMANALDAAQAWYRRHGLASAAAGGLFPDVFLRRFFDDVELSWTASPPAFAPVGFTFETEPGWARLAVADVAEPLWQLLHWVQDNPPAMDTPDFRADWEALAAKIEALDRLAPERFNAADVAEQLLLRVRASFRERAREDLLQPKLAAGGRYAEATAPAVAMFGGLSIDLSDGDIATLRDTLIAAVNGEPSDRLTALVESAPLRGKPWDDGYGLAESLLDQLEGEGYDLMPTGFVDIHALCGYLGIDLKQEQLDDTEIRGVALAGEGFSPSILVNASSRYNRSEDGRRFTLAHELCHILHDQSRARRLAHASGDWAAPGVEKRANAFAAWLLMPPRLFERHFGTKPPVDVGRLREAAERLRVGDSALVEHMHNLDLIGETERENLRAAIRDR